MSAAGGCAGCGAVLASDQEYCLECGARRQPPAISRWRTPLIAAAIAGALLLAGMVFGYQRMRDDAQSEATGAAAGPQRVSAPAPASGLAVARAGSAQARPEQSGQPLSR